MLRSRHSWVLRYIAALLASFAALILTQILWHYIQPALYPFFLAAVMLSSWFGGLGPGLVSTLLGVGFSEYFFMPPIESATVNWANLGRVIYFISVAVLICILNARLRYAQRYAEVSSIEARHNQALLLQNQETLRQSEERYRLLVEGVTGYAIFMLDPSGYILSWTIGAEQILGYEEAEIIGQSVSILFPEEALQQGLPEQVLRTAEIQGFSKDNCWHIRKDKTPFWAHCVIATLRDESGNLQGFSNIIQDITARKKAEEERNQLLQREQLARQEAESANQAKDEFLAILSHELRTPLTAITGWVGMLRSGRLDNVRATLALETIERNAILQMQLVEDLLDISRIIRGDLWLDNQPVDLVKVIREAIEIMQLKIEEKQIQFTSNIDSPDENFSNQQSDQPEQTSALVLGDAERLQQVVLNLLSNAIKFTPKKGAITVNLSIVSHPTSDYTLLMSHNDSNSNHNGWDLSQDVQLQIKDTGIGIKAEFLPHVFDRFRQADSTNTRSYKGLGLGLTIARYLVERQGGNIQADSLGEGQGATFTVKFPLLIPTTISNIIDSRLDASPEFGLNGLSILVVDDEVDTRNWLKASFEIHQAQVIAVASVDEAITQLNYFSPDVVVSDIAMPSKDGYTLMDELKQHHNQSGQPIPAIALTAHASLEDLEKSRIAGFQQHLAKPIKTEALIAVIAKLLQQRNPV